MDELGQREQVSGRSVAVSVWGANTGALEMAALDAAREFFGPEVHLEVVPDYQAHCYKDEPRGRFHANVTVREVV